MKMVSILTLAVCLLLPLSATTAYAKTSANDNRATSAANESKRSPTNLKINSSAQAVQLVKRQYQGKVLKAQSTKSNGRPGYRVKMISTEGRVFYVFVDAQTGSISGK